MIFKPLNVQANLKVTKCKSSPGGGGGGGEGLSGAGGDPVSVVWVFHC